MRIALAALALGLVAACGSPPATYRDLDRMGQEYQRPPENAEQATDQDTCGAARFRNLIGTEASAIDRSTMPANTRFITPGMMVTQDFSSTRLNVFVGVDGRVGSMRCF
jgi:hypothetical protein